MPTLDKLFADATQLPVAERYQLAEALWDTIPDDFLPPLSDEWIAEINRRSAEFDKGNVNTVSWDQIKAEAIRRIGPKDVPG